MTPQVGAGRSEPILANGVSGITGRYAIPPQTIDEIAAMARSERGIPTASLIRARPAQETFGARFGVDVGDPKQVGWGIVVATEDFGALTKALAALIQHRRETIPPAVFKILTY